MERPFAELFAQLAARVSGVVVNISTTKAIAQPPKTAQETTPNSPGASLDDFFRDFFGEKGGPGSPGGPGAPPIASLGSGFIIDPSGVIVTNNHVIANAEQITVTLSDDTVMQARVIGRDPVTDLALLKVEPKGPLPAANWGDSGKVRVGDWVLAIGNPFGLGGTVTSGIISATARDIHSGPYDEYLQTDASINRGNSGGPMFNLDGEVIGINTAIYSPSGGSIGIGFAIPAALAQRITEQLKASGKVERGWIGARIQPVTDEIAESIGLDKARGAVVASIDPGSPAAGAKIAPGDVILSYDGKPIERSRQLPRLVADSAPEKPVRVSVWRDGKEYEIEMKVVALDPNRAAPPPPEPEKPKPPPTVDLAGLKLAKISPDLRKQFSLPENARGVVIVDVQNSAAATQGLRPGDLLVAIGDTAVTAPGEATQLAAAARKAGHKNVLLRVEREGNTRFIAVAIETG
jgi:serine protease Do